MNECVFYHSTLYLYIKCALGSASIAYVSLSYHINTFDKNYRCLEKLMKITYDPPINPF